MSDEDDYEEGVEVVYAQPPTYRGDPWNVVGIAATALGGVFGVLQQGLNMVANECWTHARWRKQQREAQEYAEYLAEQEYQERQAREALSLDLERMTGIDTYWLDQEQEGGTS